MLIVEVDRIHVESAETPLDRVLDIVRPATDATPGGIFRVPQDAELRREENLVTFAFDGPPNELLVGIRSVHVGCVEEVDTQLQCSMNCGRRFHVVTSAVELAHPHAAESHGRYS